MLCVFSARISSLPSLPLSLSLSRTETFFLSPFQVCEDCPDRTFNAVLLVSYAVTGMLIVTGMVLSTLMAGHAKVEHEQKVKTRACAVKRRSAKG